METYATILEINSKSLQVSEEKFIGPKWMLIRVAGIYYKLMSVKKISNFDDRISENLIGDGGMTTISNN